MAGEGAVSVAVVTGGHSFDVVGLHSLFRELPGIDAYVQHMDDFASSPDTVRDAYDVALFYIMLTDGPSDEGHAWYQGRPRAALGRLGETRQGIVVLHHGLLAYPNWGVWDAIVGVTERPVFGYDMDQRVRVHVADPGHPIVSGMADWEMTDETYSMRSPDADCHVLLTTDHPKSVRELAWTRQYRNSRVACLQSGHDAQSWRDSNFREVLRRAILWAPGRD